MGLGHVHDIVDNKIIVTEDNEQALWSKDKSKCRLELSGIKFVEFCTSTCTSNPVLTMIQVELENYGRRSYRSLKLISNGTLIA